MNNIKSYKVNKNQLLYKLGEAILPNEKVGLGYNKFIVYLNGDKPVWIKSRLTKTEFYNLYLTNV